MNHKKTVFSLFDVVILTEDIPEAGLESGMMGAVIEVYCHPVEGYEVEFCDEEGATIALLALSPQKLRYA